MGKSVASKVICLPWVRIVADDAADDVADGAASSVQTVAARDVTMRHARVCKSNDGGVALSEPAAVICPYRTAHQRLIGLRCLNSQEWAYQSKHVLGFWHVSQSPMVFRLPFWTVERHAGDRTDAETLLNGFDRALFSASDRDFNAAFARQVDATLTIEETSEPARKLLVRERLKHAPFYYGVPLQMGRAIARAVRAATENQQATA